MRLSPAFSSFLDKYVLFCIYFAAAAASFNGFYDKWSLRDSLPFLSIEKVLDGTADRPYVYRQLLPTIANGLERSMPRRLRTGLISTLTTPDPFTGEPRYNIHSLAIRNPAYTVRYFAVYCLSFLFLFAALFAMRQVCLNAGFGRTSGSFVPVLFALFFPFLLTGGGYYYDLSELFFLMAAMALALSGGYWWLAPLTLLAAWNKESFLLFLPALFPLLRVRLSRRAAAAFLGLLVLLGVGVNLALRLRYRANPGAALEIHLFENLHSYFNLKTLFDHEINFGLITPRGYSAFALLLVGTVVARGWPRLGKPVRRHIAIAACINVPLFIVCCQYNELRDLSLMYGGLVLLMAECASLWLRAAASGPPSSTGE